MKKRNSKSRIRAWLTGISAFLVITLCIGLLAQILPNSSFKTILVKPTSADTGFSEMPMQPFKGTKLSTVDFEGIEDYFYLNKYANNHTPIPGIVFNQLSYGNPVLVTEGDNTYFKFKVDDYVNNTESAYITFLPNDEMTSFDTSFTLSDYSYMTVDFDFLGGDPRMQMVLIGRDANRSFMTASTSVFTGVNDYGGHKDAFWSFSTYKSNLGNLKYEYTFDRWYHVTFVYQIDHENIQNSRMNVYIDGEYAYTVEHIFNGVSTLIEGIRFNVMEMCRWTPDSFYCIDNFAWYGFEAGYRGDISRLFKDTSLGLKDCSDSLYGK